MKEILHKDLRIEFAEFFDILLRKFEENKVDEKTLKYAKEIIENLQKRIAPINEKLLLLNTPIGVMIAEILMNRSPIKLLVYREKDEFMLAIEGYRLNTFSKETILAVQKQPHLVLLINELIANVLLDGKDDCISKGFGFISEKEKEILNAIRDSEVSEILIKKDQNENLTLTTTGRSKLSDDKVQQLKRILRMNEYDEVRVVLRNQKEIYLENKIKKKFGPDTTAQV